MLSLQHSHKTYVTLRIRNTGARPSKKRRHIENIKKEKKNNSQTPGTTKRRELIQIQRQKQQISVKHIERISTTMRKRRLKFPTDT